MNTESTAPRPCSITMADGKACGRPVRIVGSRSDHGRTKLEYDTVCIMHSKDPNKSSSDFLHETFAMLEGTSKYDRLADTVDFSRFIFPEADFSAHRFSKKAAFEGATFLNEADFSWATFEKGVDFSGARFGAGVDFSLASFHDVADFRSVIFARPKEVTFLMVNSLEDSREGLRVRLNDCNIDDLEFTAVNWYRSKGRIMLQDELDTRQAGWREHKLVAATYRRLVNNFEKVRAYDHAEDCFIGEMEMRRLDPGESWFTRMVVTLYKWASYYGSSYQRAFVVLLGLLVAFGGVFALVWLEPLFTGTSPRQVTGGDVWRAIKDGLFHSLEVATFQRDTLYANPAPLDRVVAMVENILVPSQLALLLLALRRRFKR